MNVRTRAALIVAGSAVLLVGCGAPASTSGAPNGVTGRTAAESPPAAVGSAPLPAPDQRQIVLTVTGQAALVAPVERIDDLAADARTHSVVFGRVSEVEDFCANNAGYRLMTVQVTSTVKGEQLGTVRVVEDGGIVSGSCIAPIVDGKFGESAKLGPNDFVDFHLEGHPHTQVGAEVIAFVGPQDPDQYGATHQLVDGVQGLLVKSDDRFLRAVLLETRGVESSIPAMEAESRLEIASRG